MTRLLEENKSLAWLTAGILVVLGAALAAAMVYIDQHLSHGGKGSIDATVEAVLFAPALALAATLLLLLCFGHSLWRLLFFIALAVNLVVLLFTISVSFSLLSSETAQWHASFLGYLNELPIPCDILLVIIYFRRQ